MSRDLHFSIGIMAYNEEKNIGKLLQAVQEQETEYQLDSVVVVASGCTDKTCQIVKAFQKKQPSVALLYQSKREGKASAINLFLKRVNSDIIILESADTLPEPGAFQKLLAPFEDDRIGAVGARVKPLNCRELFLDFYVQLFWELHHTLALKSPKCGELLAFRNCLPGIAKDTATDETWIIALLTKMGYQICYQPEAVVYNYGATAWQDLCKQRVRHMIGYYHLKEHLGFIPLTMHVFSAWQALLQSPLFKQKPLWSLGVVALEAWLRMKAKTDYYLRQQNPFIWDVAPSTKDLPELALHLEK